MLGYVAENLLSGLAKNVQWHEVDSYRARGYEIVDVRSASEFQGGSIPGSINIPVDSIRERLGEISHKDLVVTCQGGVRSHTASLLLNKLGFNALNLDGGYETWSKSPAMVAGELVK